MKIDKLITKYKWLILIIFALLVVAVLYLGFFGKNNVVNEEKGRFVGINPVNINRSPFSYGRDPYYADNDLSTMIETQLAQGVSYRAPAPPSPSELDWQPEQSPEEPEVVQPRKSSTEFVTGISKGERACLEALDEIFNYRYVFKSVRPKWLKNPKTGRSLELDCYNEELKLAVEYQGSQHYIFPNSFHKTKKDYEDQLYRDQIKLDICDDHGIYVITVPYTVKNEDIKDYITYYLPENRQSRLDQNETN